MGGFDRPGKRVLTSEGEAAGATAPGVPGKRTLADADLGAGTQSGLVEAFGSDEWRTMDAVTCLGKLKTAKVSAPAGSKNGQHELRFGEMFKDGVLDMGPRHDRGARL
jgi:hypothetical protein